MDALLQCQYELAAKLDYEEAFQYISVKSYRKYLISSERDKRLPHLTLKNGKQGCGVLVGMPLIKGVDENVSTLQSEILVPIDTVAHMELNQLSNGTFQEPESIARAVRSHLHAFRIEGLTFLVQDKTAIEPMDLKESHPGCIGYRTWMCGRLQEDSPKRLGCPYINCTGTTLTLIPTFDGQTVIYTVDGSQPIPTDTAAIRYTQPFTVPVGTLVRWAAYAAGWQGSDYGWAVTNNQ